MSKILIAYSSISGNTKAVAEAIAEVCPSDPTISIVRQAPAGADDYDFVVVGYWVDKGMPDAMTMRYLKTLSGKKIAFFGTLGAAPDSEHAKSCMKATEELVAKDGNEVVGHFLCQGKVNPKIIARVAEKQPDIHPVKEECIALLQEADTHPNQEDFAQAKEAFSAIFAQLAA